MTTSTYINMKATKRTVILKAARLIVAVAIAVTPAAVTAQSTQTPAQPVAQAGAVALSLDDAVKMAEGQSEAVRIARAGIQRASGQQLQSRSQLLPQIFGSGSYTRTLKSQYSGSGIGSADTTTGPTSPPGPCEDYLNPNASIAERIA